METPIGPILNLKWRQHCLELTTLLEDIRGKGIYSDAIISCEDQQYHVHSALLSISSDFFAQIFKGRCCEKPLIVIKDVSANHLEKLLIYIYSGEVSIRQDEMPKFIELAKSLQIKGTNFKNMGSSAISAMKMNNIEYRIIENNLKVEQLKNIDKNSDSSKFLEPNLIRNCEPNQSISKKSISENLSKFLNEKVAEIQTLVKKDEIENKNSNQMQISKEPFSPRCSNTSSIPMDLTLNIMAPTASTLPHPVSQSSSLLSSPSSLSSSLTSSSSSLSSSALSSSLSSSPSSLSSLPLSSSTSLPHIYGSKSSLSPSSTSSAKASLTSATSVVNVVTGGVPTLSRSISHSPIPAFEALIKDEPEPNHKEDLPESEKGDKILTHSSIETQFESGDHDGDLVNKQKKVLKAIPPMIPLTTSSEFTLQMQNNSSNETATKYMTEFRKFTNEEQNQGVITSHSSSSVTQPAPSRPPGPRLPPALSRPSGPRPPHDVSQPYGPPRHPPVLSGPSGPPRPPPELSQPSGPHPSLVLSRASGPPRPPPDLLPKSALMQATSRPQLSRSLSLNTSSYSRPKPHLNDDSHLALNSRSYPISSVNRDNDPNEKNGSNNPSDKTWYKVYPNGEDGYPEEDCTNKPSEKAWQRSDEMSNNVHTQSEIEVAKSTYSVSSQSSEEIRFNQPSNQSKYNLKDLDPRNPIRINDHSSEVNPVIVRNTQLANRNPRLLVNHLPVGPSRYSSNLVVSNKRPSDKISMSGSDVTESPKGSVQMNSAYRIPLTSTTTQLGPTTQFGVRKDLLHQPNLNLQIKDSPLNNSREIPNASAILPVQPVTLSPKDKSQYQSESDSDFTYEDGNSSPIVQLNRDLNSNSSGSNTQPLPNNDSHFSLPSTSKNHFNKNENGNSKQNSSDVSQAPSKFKNPSDPMFQKFPTTLHRRRFRGPKAWEFLARMLKDPSSYGKVIRWEDEEQLVFRLVDPNEIARRWQCREVNNAKAKNYHNFARSLRYHYQTGALAPVSERQLVYKFGPNARKVLREYDNIFNKTDSLPNVSSQNTYSDLVRIEREHYDNNPEFSGRSSITESHSAANPSSQPQVQTETVPQQTADLTSGIIVSQSSMGPLNYGITYRTPSGNILPVPNFNAVPYPLGPSASIKTNETNSSFHPDSTMSRNTNLSPTGKDINTCSTPMPTSALPPFSKIKAAQNNMALSKLPALKPISALQFTNQSSINNSTSKMFIAKEFEIHSSPIMNTKTNYKKSSLTENNFEQNSVNPTPIKSHAQNIINNEDINSSKLVQSNPNISSRLQLSNSTNSALDPFESTLDNARKEKDTMPIFISKSKSFSNGSSVPTSQSIIDKEINNYVSTIKSTTASNDRPEKNYDDSYSGNETKEISIGKKHKMEENEMPIDFKKRWKNDNPKY